MSSYRPLALIAILVIMMLSSSYSASAASEGNVSNQNRLNSWEYAWETTVENESTFGKASSGWDRLPHSNWKRSDKLLNPEGRNQANILWFRTKLPVDGYTYDSMKIRVSLL